MLIFVEHDCPHCGGQLNPIDITTAYRCTSCNNIYKDNGNGVLYSFGVAISGSRVRDIGKLYKLEDDKKSLFNYLNKIKKPPDPTAS